MFARADGRRLAARRHARDAGRGPAARRGGRRACRRSRRCATPSRAPASVRLPARARARRSPRCSAARPQARRRRPPAGSRAATRCATRAAPLATAAGADDRRRAGDAGHRRGRGPAGHDDAARSSTASTPTTWSPARTAGRRPTRPSQRAVAGRRRHGDHGIRQDRGARVRRQGDVNSIDPATGRGVPFDWVEGDDGVPATLGDDGAIVDEGWAKEHGLGVGDRFTLTSAKGVELPLTVRGIEDSPVIDAHRASARSRSRKPAYDRAFENAPQPAARSPRAATRRAGARAASRTRKVRTKAALHRRAGDVGSTSCWRSSTSCSRWP